MDSLAERFPDTFLCGLSGHAFHVWIAAVFFFLSQCVFLPSELVASEAAGPLKKPRKQVKFKGSLAAGRPKRFANGIWSGLGRDLRG